jgi:hypothetical protein
MATGVGGSCHCWAGARSPGAGRRGLDIRARNNRSAGPPVRSSWTARGRRARAGRARLAVGAAPELVRGSCRPPPQTPEPGRGMDDGVGRRARVARLLAWSSAQRCARGRCWAQGCSAAGEVREAVGSQGRRPGAARSRTRGGVGAWAARLPGASADGVATWRRPSKARLGGDPAECTDGGTAAAWAGRGAESGTGRGCCSWRRVGPQAWGRAARWWRRRGAVGWGRRLGESRVGRPWLPGTASAGAAGMAGRTEGRARRGFRARWGWGREFRGWEGEGRGEVGGWRLGGRRLEKPNLIPYWNVNP